MSRVAKNPVAIPAGVEVKFSETEVSVKGSLGTLSTLLCSEVDVKLDNSQLTFVAKNESKFAGAMVTVRLLKAGMTTKCRLCWRLPHWQMLPIPFPVLPA